MRFSICQILSIFVIFGLLFTSGIGPDISMVYAHEMIEKTITKTKIYDEVHEVEKIYRTVRSWSDTAGQYVETQLLIKTRTTTKKVWSGDYDVTESTKQVAHTHPRPWYKDPTVLIAGGTLIVTIITLFVDNGGNGE